MWGLQPRGAGCCHAGVTLHSHVQATAITSVGTQGGKPGSRESGAVIESDYEYGPGVGQEGWEVKEDGWDLKASTRFYSSSQD